MIDKLKDMSTMGRPRITGKSYHYKADEDLIPILDAAPNRNRLINVAVKEYIKRNKLTEDNIKEKLTIHV